MNRETSHGLVEILSAPYSRRANRDAFIAHLEAQAEHIVLDAARCTGAPIWVSDKAGEPRRSWALFTGWEGFES